MLKVKTSENKDMNGRKCRVGDTMTHHRHDPNQSGDICKHDTINKLKHDAWGRVRSDSNYLSWLMEKQEAHFRGEK